MKLYRSCSVGKWLIILIALISLYSLPSLAQTSLTIDAIVLHNANLRAGPGVTHAIIGAVRAGQLATITDYEGEWYQLSTGEWIAKFLVKATAESRVVAFRLEDAPAVANRSANLRSGPGTNYSIVGGVQAGQTLQIIGQNQTGDWFKLRDGQWIAAFLVNRIATGLPIDEEYLTLQGTIPPTPSVTPTAAQSTVPAAVNCELSYPGICIPRYPPDLNCGDIPYTNFPIIGADPHDFDDNDDGIGCER